MAVVRSFDIVTMIFKQLGNSLSITESKMSEIHDICGKIDTFADDYGNEGVYCDFDKETNELIIGIEFVSFQIEGMNNSMYDVLESANEFKFTSCKDGSGNAVIELRFGVYE